MAFAIPAGFPNSTTTGVPPGVTLTASGSIVVTESGTVLSGLDIHGSVYIPAGVTDVTIENCRITTSARVAIDGYGSVTVRNCEINGLGNTENSYAIQDVSGNFLNNNIYGFENGIEPGSNSVIKGNYIHDLQAGGPEPHYDGIALHGGQSNVLIEGNTIIGRDNADVYLTNGFGPISNVTITDNYFGVSLSGTGPYVSYPVFTIFIDGSNPNSSITGISVTDNYVEKGVYGYIEIWDVSATVSGNHELTTVSNLIEGGSDNDVLTGHGNNDTMYGHGNDDTIYGGDGSDLLNGGGGNDTLDGQGGVDTADYQDKTTAVVVTLNGSTSATVAVGGVVEDTIKNIENVYGGLGKDTLRGDGMANYLYGYDGNDTIRGGGGKDTLDGAAGVDTVDYSDKTTAVVVTLNGANNATVTVGGVAEDTIRNIENVYGGLGNDTLTGDGLANILDGGLGADIMQGGLGNDLFIVDNAGDQTIETSTGGVDKVQSSLSWTLAANVENLTLAGTASINATGNGLANAVTGNSGANVLQGLAGSDILTGFGGNDRLDGGTDGDTMAGGNGNDTYIVDNLADRADESSGSGVDLVQSLVTFTLAGGVENLTLTGGAAVNGTGNGLANTISGNSAGNLLAGLGANDTLSGLDGNDRLDGGINADAMAGGNGNDTYVIDNAGDTASEASGSGTDLVQSTVTFTLAAGIENLVLNGTAAINGTGNASANTMSGNSAVNRLDGNGGNDTMTGLGGADVFIFDDGDGADTVTDFANGSDKFDLTAVAAVDEFSDLTVIDNGATVTVNYGTGSFTLANVGNPAQLDATDFVLWN